MVIPAEDQFITGLTGLHPPIDNIIMNVQQPNTSLESFLHTSTPLLFSTAGPKGGPGVEYRVESIILHCD